MESITDELREYASDPIRSCTSQRKLFAIAGRIDAEHKALRDQLDTSERQKESYREDLLAANKLVHASYNDGFDDGFASADDWYVDHEDQLAEHGWVKLPVDADGEVIHIGDSLVLQHEVHEKPFSVQSLTWNGEDWYFTCDEGFFNVCGWAHHRKSIVEDLLQECCHKYHSLLIEDMNNAIAGVERDYVAPAEVIAEYAARLRLAGDE